MQEEKHVVSHQSSPSEHFDCEKVATRQHEQENPSTS